MNPEEETISVVIPLFNKEKFVEQSIQSILNQEIPCNEIIVVDDGSTDHSLELVKGIGHPLVKIVSQENGGVSAARNKGIAVSGGKWIAFLDADDLWLPSFLRTIRGLIQEFPTCKVFATSFYIKNLVTGDSVITSPLNLSFRSGTGVIGNYFQVAVNSLPPVHSSAIVVEKELIESIGGFPEGVTSGEDLLTWARLALLSEVAYSKTPSTIFHIDPRLPHRLPQHDDFVGRELRKLFLKAPGQRKRWIKKYIAKWHKMRAHSYIVLGHKRRAVREIRTSIRFNPYTKIWFFLPFMLIPMHIRKFRVRVLSRHRLKR
jgi:glycosyltransferase involved in cell wall biosynthesis